MRLEGLLAHAAKLGLDVSWADLGDTRCGEYRRDEARIVLCSSLTRAQATATLAHELGHHAYGDRCSTPATERRAWAYGARLAIEPEEYAAAEQVAGSHPNLIASELGVTRRLVEAWRDAYVSSR